jgi:hypothetical protein
MSRRYKNPPITLPDATDLAKLEQQYVIENQAAVLDYLNAHPDLIPLLDETNTAIRRYFPDSPIFLEVVDDPEIPDFLQLFAKIDPPCDPEEAFIAFSHFMDDWWLDRLGAVAGKFSVTVEYR